LKTVFRKRRPRQVKYGKGHRATKKEKVKHVTGIPTKKNKKNGLV